MTARVTVAMSAALVLGVGSFTLRPPDGHDRPERKRDSARNEPRGVAPVSLFPSVYNFFSLNLISDQLSPAEARFEATHLDAGLAGAASRLVEQRSGYHADYYRLVETILQGGADEVNMVRACSTVGRPVEDAFLHYVDDSDVYGKDVGGKIHRFTIPGWGRGSASNRADARIQTFVWTQPRWVLNHRSECVRAFMVERAKADVKTRVYRGTFVDELGPECGSAGEDYSNLPRTKRGGHIAEYGSATREELIPPCPNAYQADMEALLDHVQSEVAATFPDFVIYSNIGNYDNQSTRHLCTTGAGCATERMDYETSSGQSSEEVFFNTARAVATSGRFYVWSEMHGADTDPTGDLASDYSGCNYPSKTGPRGRHSMWALSNYWIARQGNQTRFAQAPAREPNTWATPLSAIWYGALATDLGPPRSTSFTVWQSGVDAAGQKFRIHRRDYANAIVLSRSRNGWNDADWRSFGTPTPSFDLGGTYRVLYSDGSLGFPITRVGLCLAEAVTLIRGT